MMQLFIWMTLEITFKTVILTYTSTASFFYYKIKLYKSKKALKIERSDSATILEYSDGVMVTWNKMNIEIKVDDSYIGKTNGLCGFYDGQNDCNYLFLFIKFSSNQNSNLSQ